MSLVLTHNDTAVDLDAARCELGSLTRSFLGPWTLTLRRAIAFDEPSDWQNEDAVVLERDGTALFEGRIKSSERRASAAGEGIVYTCVGLREAADGLTFQRAIDGSETARVVYNCPPEEELEEYGSAVSPGEMWTVGEIVADILDAMAVELDGIVGDGSEGSGYVQSELDALASVPGKVVLNALSVDEALLAVLHHAPDFGYAIDPAGHRARFTDFRTLAATDVAGVGEAVLSQQLDFLTAGCYSACTVQGTYELIDVFEELTPAWDTELESDWTSDKASEEPDTYGMVWRLFATGEPVAEGGVVVPERFVGGGSIMAMIAYSQQGQPLRVFTPAQAVDGTKLLLTTMAREWDNGAKGHKVATVYARFTYRKDRVTGRYPASGHTGTAHSRRGLTRELFLIEEERGRKSLKGTVWKTLGTTTYVEGMTVEFNGDGKEHTVVANGMGFVVLAAAPDTPIQVDDAFVITAQDDTRKEFEGGTLSILEKYAKEILERAMDERFVGDVPLTGLDWSLALGQKISFTGTHDPEYASLGATLIAVEHDLAHERTVLSLTGDRALGGTVTWQELDQQRRRDRAIDEIRVQLRRLWRRLRNRRAAEGSDGDAHHHDEQGPNEGDGTWIEIPDNDKTVSHIGPGPVDVALGGEGQFIEWIQLDARGHLVDAGVGTFS